MLTNVEKTEITISSVQSLNHVWLFATPWTVAHQAFPSLTPRAYSNSCPSSRWCHPTISCPVIPFSSWLLYFPESGFFQWVSSSHQVVKVLEFQIQHQALQWILRTDFLRLTGFISLKSKELLRVFSNTTVKKHQFFCAQHSL